MILPQPAKEIWLQAYKESLTKNDKEISIRSAWQEVKRQGWRKIEGQWVHTDFIHEFSMHITKASLSNGVMRWAATSSDTDPDSYEEQMSLELYEDFIDRINKEKEVPEQFKSICCSKYWCGGMPYMSVSHYPDFDGSAVPGEPLELFIDGKKLKTKGVLFDSPLGHAVWRSLKDDKYKNPEEKIRISIGFLDLAHSHAGKVWVRESLISLCPDCLQGVGDKVYHKGILIHHALTRKPVNKRTEFVEEE